MKIIVFKLIVYSRLYFRIVKEDQQFLYLLFQSQNEKQFFEKLNETKFKYF